MEGEVTTGANGRLRVVADRVTFRVPAGKAPSVEITVPSSGVLRKFSLPVAPVQDLFAAIVAPERHRHQTMRIGPMITADHEQQLAVGFGGQRAITVPGSEGVAIEHPELGIQPVPFRRMIIWAPPDSIIRINS